MAKRYLQIAALAFGASLTLAVFLVLLVDPYGMFAWVDSPTFNHRKIRPSHSQFEIRSRQAARLQANAWILGNSRAEMGFDPEHPAFGQQGLVAYNLAVPGAGLGMSLKLAQALSAGQRPPKRIILGAEFLDFLVAPGEAVSPPVVYQASRREEVQWIASQLVSARSVTDAIKTIRLQRDPYAAYLTDKGFNPMLDYVKEVKTSGAHAMFQQRAAESAKSYANKPKSVAAGPDGSSSDWLALEAILALALPAQTRIDIVIYPYHAQLRWLWQGYGLNATFDEWRSQLVRRVDALAQSRQLDIRVWDFSGFTTTHCEAIPPAADRQSALRWYWEAGHFKKELGDRMLNQMFGVDDGLPPLGQLLTLANLQAKLARDEGDEARCKTELPQVFAGAQALVRHRP